MGRKGKQRARKKMIDHIWIASVMLVLVLVGRLKKVVGLAITYA
jgi:hypothetical protein